MLLLSVLVIKTNLNYTASNYFLRLLFAGMLVTGLKDNYYIGKQC
jgi:hypothetical protein